MNNVILFSNVIINVNNQNKMNVLALNKLIINALFVLKLHR